MSRLIQQISSNLLFFFVESQAIQKLQSLRQRHTTKLRQRDVTKSNSRRFCFESAAIAHRTVSFPRHFDQRFSMRKRKT